MNLWGADSWQTVLHVNSKEMHLDFDFDLKNLKNADRTEIDNHKSSLAHDSWSEWLADAGDSLSAWKEPISKAGISSKTSVPATEPGMASCIYYGAILS